MALPARRRRYIDPHSGELIEGPWPPSPVAARPQLQPPPPAVPPAGSSSGPGGYEGGGAFLAMLLPVVVAFATRKRQR